MSNSTIVRMKITLDDVTPAVSRTLEVPLNIRLDRLHTVIQTAFSGTVRISVCGRAVDHQAAMALMKRSPKSTANCAFAMFHSRGGIFHSFSDRFKIR